MKGRVVSKKMNKTAVVLVEGTKTHPLYKKSYAFSKRYLVDDPIEVKMGDIVEMVSIRPMSKLKTWRITKVVGRDIEEIVKEQLEESAAQAIGEVMPEEKESSDISPQSSDENEEKEENKETKKKGKKSDS